MRLYIFDRIKAQKIVIEFVIEGLFGTHEEYSLGYIKYQNKEFSFSLYRELYLSAINGVMMIYGDCYPQMLSLISLKFWYTMKRKTIKYTVLIRI